MGGRQTIKELKNAKDDVDRMATYGNKITGLSDKLLSLHAGLDDERNARFEQLQGKIKSLDDRLSAWQNIGAKKYNVVKGQFCVFEDAMKLEKAKREEVARGNTEEIAAFAQTLDAALKGEQNSLRSAEERILQVFESKRVAIRDDMLSIGRTAGNNEANLRRYLEDDVPRLYEMLREETKSREQMEKQMLSVAMAEVAELQGVIAAEKQKREDTEEVMLRMMEDAVAKMQTDIANERRERKHTEEMLLNLLQETCTKLQVTSKSL